MNDLISREAAIKHLYGRLIESANNNVGVREDAGIVFEDIATERLKTWIYEIPTAEKAGKWMEQERGIHTTKYRCSECGRVVWDDTGYDVCTDYPYCNCGARMKGAEDESKD
jgi:hypothetical protein